MSEKIFSGLFLVGIVCIFVAQGQVAPVIPEDCIGCICQASTGCNMTMSCIENNRLCGPFLISRPYWIDAGKFVLANDNPERDGAFEACVLDPICASETVRGYMVKFAQDCNRDGIINCDDFASLHLLGGFGCSGSIKETIFFKRYLQCRTTVATLSG